MTVVVQSPSLLATVRLIAADIKLAHSVFAMPFALLAAFMAAAPGEGDGMVRWDRFAGQLALIVLAMVLARTAAMLANRLLDARIDSQNPRTAGRAIPSGRLPISRALVALLLCSALFLLACAAFGFIFENWWPLTLGPAVLLWISAYPLLKRFTALCHLYLGASLAISPLAAAIAVDPTQLASQPALWLLSAAVLCWVAGFDIIYALQDVQVDRVQGLCSMPSRIGIAPALWVSRTLHFGAVACLAACALGDDRLRILFACGVVIAAALLAYEHFTVRRWGTSRIALTFFTINGVISCVIGALGIADVLL